MWLQSLVCVHTEIEMVVMEKCKVSELTEQNITDEEKTAAATRIHAQRSRYMNHEISPVAKKHLSDHTLSHSVSAGRS